jgi:hypothetical protein
MAKYKGFSLTKVRNTVLRRLLIIPLLPITLLILVLVVVGEIVIGAFLASLAQVADGIDHLSEGCLIILKAARKSWRTEK